MSPRDIKRLREKLETSPPHDWEDDVEMLLDELEAYIQLHSEVADKLNRLNRAVADLEQVRRENN